MESQGIERGQCGPEMENTLLFLDMRTARFVHSNRNEIKTVLQFIRWRIAKKIPKRFSHAESDSCDSDHSLLGDEL